MGGIASSGRAKVRIEGVLGKRNWRVRVEQIEERGFAILRPRQTRWDPSCDKRILNACGWRALVMSRSVVVVVVNNAIRH